MRLLAESANERALSISMRKEHDRRTLANGVLSVKDLHAGQQSL